VKRAMIVSLVLGLILLVSSRCTYASEIEADSRITEVMVYPDSALVGRTTILRLEQEKHRIIFSDIVPHIDEDNLSISCQWPLKC
jgi:hypothetical protein